MIGAGEAAAPAADVSIAADAPGAAGDGSRPAIAVVGVTAVGKSDVALALAARLDAEIVSLDSRLLYRGMDIGTAKPSAAERAAAPHHLIDIADPSAVLSLADVLAGARAALAAIRGRGRRPILVGGTGQYVRALREGWSVPPVPPDAPLRAALFALAAAEGPPALHARLLGVDPASAARLHPNNVRRIVRALEVFEATGRPLSAWQAERADVQPIAVIGLHRADEDLGRRIDARIERMIEAGLEAEVRALVARGVGFDHPNMSGVGYREWRDFFAGDAAVRDVAARLRETTRRLVRKQSLWFRRDDPSIVWLDVESGEPAADTARRALAALEGLAAGGPGDAPHGGPEPASGPG